jgi:hypothetical protein
MDGNSLSATQPYVSLTTSSQLCVSVADDQNRPSCYTATLEVVVIRAMA